MFTTIKTILTGVAIGILIAPDKGSKTRKRIANALSEKLNDAENYVEDQGEQLERKVNSSRKILKLN